jgi:hypothetical protein
LVELNERAAAFLRNNHAAIMVTVRTDGSAHVARVSCGLVDGRVWSSGTESRVRTKHLRTNPHGTLSVFSTRDRLWLGVEALVVIHDGADAPQKTLALHRAMGREPEDVDQFLQNAAAQKRIIYEFQPTRIYGAALEGD